MRIDEETTVDTDVVEKLENSIIQHGKFNERVYLMKLEGDDLPEIIPQMESLCREEDYSKIFAKVPSSLSIDFIKENYQREAYIPGFFKGEEDAVFLTKYFSPERKEKSAEELLAFRSLLEDAPATSPKSSLNPRFTIQRSRAGDVTEMAALYRQVFRTYPFPIHDPDYLLEMMEENVYYYCVRTDDRIIGLSSAEVDPEFLNAEMTDFAVLPDFRGNRLAFHLLMCMEEEMSHLGICTAYTIARLKSLGINGTFLKAGYHYSGTLINNTNISGDLESMNVWYKNLC